MKNPNFNRFICLSYTELIYFIKLEVDWSIRKALELAEQYILTVDFSIVEQIFLWNQKTYPLQT